MPSSVPQRSGDATPAGGGTWAAVARNSSPRKPSGVQLARRDRARRAGTRAPARRRPRLVGSEHRAEHGQHGVVVAVRVRQRLGVGLGERDVEPLGRARARDRARAARGRSRCRSRRSRSGRRRSRRCRCRRRRRGRASRRPGRRCRRAARRRCWIRRRDHAEVAAGPHGLLAALDGGEIDRSRELQSLRVSFVGRIGRVPAGRREARGVALAVADGARARFQRGNNGAGDADRGAIRSRDWASNSASSAHSRSSTPTAW